MKILYILPFALLLLVWLLRFLIIWSIKQKIKAKKKVPFLFCDKGHMYPADTALSLPLDGITQDPISVCPFCYALSLKNADNFKKV